MFDQLNTFLIKQQLNELLLRYAHAVDRRDAAALSQLWWPDGQIDFGLFKGPTAEFIELICQENPSILTSYHSITNALFTLDGQRARGHCYVTAMSSFKDPDNGATDQLVGGRYLDRFEQRDGQWRFIEKLFVLDWTVNQPHSAIWDKGIGAAAARGVMGPTDPSYRH